VRCVTGGAKTGFLLKNRILAISTDSHQTPYLNSLTDALQVLLSTQRTQRARRKTK